MAFVFVRLRAEQLATLIGVVELFLSELFRAGVGCASAWERRHRLYKQGRLHIKAAKRSAVYATIALTCALIVLMALTIALELTVAGTRKPSPKTESRLCYGTKRDTRYSQNNGAEQDETTDPKIDTYLRQAACPQLIGRVPYGQDLFKMPFPTCLPKLGPLRRVALTAKHLGCGLGFVGNNGEDIHCDMLPVGYKSKATLAQSQFIGIHAIEHNSTSSLRFKPYPKGRYLSNYRIPFPLVPITVNTSAIKIPCKDLKFGCYNLSRKLIPDNTTGEPLTLDASEGILVQVLRRNASLCIFESMRTTVKYVRANQTFPNWNDRAYRDGPLATKIQVSGFARCIENLNYNVSRMYYDALERIVKTKNDNLTMVRFLNRAAVATVRRTPEDNARRCEVRSTISGAQMSTDLLIATAVYSVLLFLATLAMFAYTIYVWQSCPAREDPLTPMWSLRHILREQGKIKKGDDAVQDVWIGVVDSGEGQSPMFDVHPTASFDATPGSSIYHRRSRRRTGQP